MQYGPHGLLIFRSKDHMDDWRYNPYHGKKQRDFLVKLQIDFLKDMEHTTTTTTNPGGGGGMSSSSSSLGGIGGNNEGSGGTASTGEGSTNTTKEASGSGNSGKSILGHRLLPVKKKSYGKNEDEMYQFKLERWTNLGCSVLAAFASHEEEEVQILHDTITEMLKSCPNNGLGNIDHMLK